MIAVLMAVNYVLTHRTAAVERSQIEAKRLRDTSYEMTILLRQKTGSLLKAGLRDPAGDTERTRTYRP